MIPQIGHHSGWRSLKAIDETATQTETATKTETETQSPTLTATRNSSNQEAGVLLDSITPKQIETDVEFGPWVTT